MSEFKEFKEEHVKKMGKCLAFILTCMKENKITLSQAGGILGAAMGAICAKTDQDFCFVSFFNSFTRSYHANYSGNDQFDLSGPIYPLKQEN